MPAYLQERELKIWGFRKDLSIESNVIALLGKMATFRQGRADPATLLLYAEVLIELDLRAFQVAMSSVSHSEREEGETAFPSLGTILRHMDEAREFFPKFSAGATEINTKPLYVEERKQIGPKPVARLKA